MPQNPQFPPVMPNPQMPLEPIPVMPQPKKRKKTGLIVTIVIVVMLILALVGWFVANALVAKMEEDDLKATFTNSGFSNVTTEINSDPMLISYLKGHYRHLRITAGERTLKQENSKDKTDKDETELPTKIKDIAIDAYGFSRDDNRIEKGSVSFTLPGEEFDKYIADSTGTTGLNINRKGNNITVAGEQEGLPISIGMTMRFKPGENGKSGKLVMAINKIMINGSEEFLGQKLHPADLGMKAEEEIPLPIAEGMTLKNIEFSGNDIKYDLTFNNLTLSDLT